MKNFLTKIEVAEMILNQFDYPEDLKHRAATKMARLHEVYFQANVKKAGFSVENFGYNRYFIN